MRTPIIAGNWKMYKGPAAAADLAKALVPLVADAGGVEIVICPPNVSLSTVASLVNGSNVKLGAQNMYPMAEGAFTGENSPAMLKEIGCTHCILGHSERRQYFFEADSFIRAKVKAALEFGLVPIVCVGETLDERERNRTYDRIDLQIDEALAGLEPKQAEGIVIAYEPVWAIGTGRNATPEQAQEVHAYIRRKLQIRFGQDAAEKIRILYGGSVKPDNVDGLMVQKDIDGALVGGASLKADGFARIVKFQKP